MEVGGTDGTDKKDAVNNQMNKSNEEIRKEVTKPIDSSSDTQSTDSQPKIKTWGKSGSKKTDAPDVAEPEATPVKLKKAAPKQKPAEDKPMEMPSLKPTKLKKVEPKQKPVEEKSMEKPSLKPAQLKRVEPNQKPVDEISLEKTTLKPIRKSMKSESEEKPEADDDQQVVKKVKTKKVKKSKSEEKSAGSKPTSPETNDETPTKGEAQSDINIENSESTESLDNEQHSETRIADQKDNEEKPELTKESDAPRQSMESPTFVEKPEIVILDEGKLVQLIVLYKSSSKCKCSWSYKENMIQESSSMKVVHEKIDSTSYECRLEIKEPDEKNTGMYKCLISNEKGEINANLMLNIQTAQTEPTMEINRNEEEEQLVNTAQNNLVSRQKSTKEKSNVEGNNSVETGIKESPEKPIRVKQKEHEKIAMKERKEETKELIYESEKQVPIIKVQHPQARDSITAQTYPEQDHSHTSKEIKINIEV